MRGTPGWAQAIVLIAAVIVAIQTIWKKLVKPLLTAADQMKDNAATLKAIADEWSTNGGSSLKDAVDRIEGKADESLQIAKELRDGPQAEGTGPRELRLEHGEDAIRHDHGDREPEPGDHEDRP